MKQSTGRWQWRRRLAVLAALSAALASTAGVGCVSAMDSEGVIDDAPLSITRASIETAQAHSTGASVQNLVASGDDAAAATKTVSRSDPTATDSVVTSAAPASSGSASSASASSSAPSSSSASASSSASSSSSGSDASAESDPTASSGSYYNATIGYDCSCSDARKVSLMGASDYCLAPGARYSAKCGNQMLGELGECPRTGAQPCSDLGHVLTEDSVCELDDKDDVYKCTASADDQDIQSGKKKKKKSPSSGEDALGNGARGSTGGSLATCALTLAAVVLVGGWGDVGLV